MRQSAEKERYFSLCKELDTDLVEELGLGVQAGERGE